MAALQRQDDKNWKEQYFSKLANKSVKCKKCCTTYRSPNNGTLISHLTKSHQFSILNIEKKLQWLGKRALLWWYFTLHFPKAIAKQTCNSCETSLNTCREVNLETHLRSKHSEFLDEIYKEIENTWLSQYFIVDRLRTKAECMVDNCSWTVNIFFEKYVLVNHLFKCHNINEHLGSPERIVDNNMSITTQRSVLEANYPGSNSHRDNTHEQDTGHRQIQ